MKKIRNFLGLIAWLAAMMLLACACSDSLAVTTRYVFDLETMPVPKRLAQDSTAEIRCQLVREGDYDEARYFIRYFQPDGAGELRLDDGTRFALNDRYPLDRMTFRLYYTSRCDDQQTIDIYVEDNAGQVVQKTFNFQNEGTENDDTGEEGV